MANPFTVEIPTNLLATIDILSSQDQIFSSGFLTDLRQLRQILSRFGDVLIDPDHVPRNLVEKLSNALRKLEHEAFRRRGSFQRKVSLFIWRIKINLISYRLAGLLANIPAPNCDVLNEMPFITDSEGFFPVLGRDNDKKNIIDILKQESDVEKLSVVPIVGTAGVGKSTLARLVYNDTTINEYFQLKFWVNVSEEFDVIRLFKDVLTSATDRKYIDFCKDVYMSATDRVHIDLTLDELLDYLLPILQDKKILLILDNVRNEYDFKWSKVKDLFTGVVAKGSKILVTTRSERVASMTGTVPKYLLEGLSHQHCMSLFLSFAFEKGDERIDNPVSINIFDEIVRKASGIPLVIRSLGTLLYQTDRGNGLSHIKDYLDHAERGMCLDQTDRGNVLSYKNDTERGMCSSHAERDMFFLSLRYKQIGEIMPNILTPLNVSYDFLPPVLQKCLAYCALFPKDYRFNSDYLIQCWVAAGFLATHNEIGELEDVGLRCCKVLFFRRFFQDVEDHGYYFTFKIHDVIHDIITVKAHRECSMVDLRHRPIVDRSVRHVSFIYYSEDISEVGGIFKGLRQVETIAFPILRLKGVDESLIQALTWNRKYLRFLCLSGLQFRKLPDSIGELKSLRFLDLSWNLILGELSQNICKLHSLQTLLLLDCLSLKLPHNMGRMIGLRHLEVTADEENLEASGIADLSSLRYLHLRDCRRLQSLPSRIQSLNRLRTLILQGCHSLAALPVDSIFSLIALKYMRIEACQGLTELPAWLPDIISLETLEIVNCPGLLSLPDGMQRLTKLTQLKVQNCPILSESCRQQNSFISHVLNIQLDPAVASSSMEE